MYLLLCLTSTVVVQQTQGLQNDDDLNERRIIVRCRALEPHLLRLTKSVTPGSLVLTPGESTKIIITVAVAVALLRVITQTKVTKSSRSTQRGACVAHNNRRIITVVLLLILWSISHLFAAAATVLLRFSPETNKSRCKSEQNGRPGGSL
jgi:hypothetical protein